MPVLRSPPDNTLAETLGNLGNSLTQSFNPLNMVRSQNLVSEMQQRAWEIQHQQTLDAANRNAADAYVRTNPYNQDPASLAVSAAKIRNGQGDLTGAIDAVKTLGGWQANQNAATLYRAAHPELPPDQLASDVAELTSGRKTASQLTQDRANAALDVNKATSTITATGAAQTPASKEAAAIGQPETSVKLDAGNTLLGLPPITGSPTDPGVQELINQRNIRLGQAGIPITPDAGQAGPNAVTKLTGDIIAERAKPRPLDVPAPAVPPTNVLTGQPVTVPPGQTPSPGVISTPAQPVDTSEVNKVKSAQVAADEGTKARLSDVSADMASGSKASTLLRTVALMRHYASLLDNDTPLNQLSQTFTSAVKNELGITLDANQSAANAFQQLGNELIASVRGDDGIMRTAGPELNFFAQALPNIRQDRSSLMATLDRMEIKARNLMEIGQSAKETYNATGGNVDAASYIKHIDRKNGILAPPTANKPAGTSDLAKPLSGRGSAPPVAAGPRIWTKNPDGTMSPPPD